MTHIAHAKKSVKRRLGCSKDREQTDGQTDATNRIAFPAIAVGRYNKSYVVCCSSRFWTNRRRRWIGPRAVGHTARPNSPVPCPLRPIQSLRNANRKSPLCVVRDSGRAYVRDGPRGSPTDLGHTAGGEARPNDDPVDSLHGRGRPARRPHSNTGQRTTAVLRHVHVPQEEIRYRSLVSVSK